MAKKKIEITQIAPQEEQETHIWIDYENKVGKLYTNLSKVMRRLEKKNILFTSEEYVGKKVYSRSYELPFDEMKVFLSVTVVK